MTMRMQLACLLSVSVRELSCIPQVAGILPARTTNFDDFSEQWADGSTVKSLVAYALIL